MNLMDNSIVIVNSCNKVNLIKEISKSELSDIKVMTFNELRDKLFFSYDEQAIYEVMKLENVSCGIAKKYIENLYWIDEIGSSKVKNLLQIKEHLMDNGLLVSNPLFKSVLATKKIYIYDIPYLTKEEEKILNGFEYEFINKDIVDKEYSVYEFDTLEDEIYFVATKISELLKNGIDINRIKLINLNDEYRMNIQKAFKIFNIPTNIRPSINIYSTNLCQMYLNQGFKELERNTKTKEDEKITNKIIDICNKYVWCHDEEIKREVIVYDLKNTSLKLDEISGVEESDLKTCSYDDYLFLLGFNQGILPTIYKDEDYLSDVEKEALGQSTSFDKNSLSKLNTIYYLNNKNNITITYKLKSLTDNFYKSSLLDELNTKIIKGTIDYKHSHLFNKIMLSAKLDDYYKYGSKDSDLSYLYYNYSDINYNTYSNKYRRVKLDKINKLFQEKLLLSYTSLDTYYKCGFRYYLQYVLKIGKYEETFMQNIGNIYHYMLSVAFNKDFIFDLEWGTYLEEHNIIHNKKEEFFINKIKEEVKFVIEQIKVQEQKSILKDKFLEEKLYIKPTGNDNEVFMGIIDKLVYTQTDDGYLAAIIDYKTGNPNLNLNYLPYGLDMQLPVYLYLVNKVDKIKPAKVLGFYLQKLIHSEVTYNPKVPYLTQKKRNLMLQGYSINDEELLSNFDSSFVDSEVIKSMKVGKNGFYSYSKVLSSDEMNRISNLVEENIVKAMGLIKIGDFDINPKKIGNDNVGCEFCPFKDICYHTESDVKILKEYKDLTFLRGDKDAEMD